MRFQSWLETWIRTYPVKRPSVDRRQFTEDVMAAIQELQEQPEPTVVRPVHQFDWRSLFGFAGVAAGLAALMLLVTRPQESRFARLTAPEPAPIVSITDHAAVLAALGELTADAFPTDAELLAQEAEEVEFLQLAQEKSKAKAKNEPTNIFQTLELLRQLGEDMSNDSLSDEELLEELDLLEEVSPSSVS